MPLPGYNNSEIDHTTNSGQGQDTVSGPPINTQGIQPNYALDDISYVSAEMLNQGQTAEGSIVPPPQNGQYRVPRPTGLKATPTNTFSNWYNTAWLFRRSLTISKSLVSGTQTNFTVPISVTSTQLIPPNVQSTGNDFLFTASDGITKLNHEIELYNSTTGQLIAWVQVPSISSGSDTVIYIYYGNSTAANQQNPTGTWDSNYKGVFHLNSSSKNTISGNSASATVGAPVAITGQIDGAYSGINNSNRFDYTTSELSAVDNISKTVNYWVKSTNYAGGIITKENGSNGWAAEISSLTPTWIVAGSNTYTSATQVTSGMWSHVAIVWNHGGTSADFYVNGVFSNTDSGHGAENSASGQTLSIANRPAGSVNSGAIDEIEVSNTTRSASWIATTYNLQNTPIGNASMGAQIAVNGSQFTISWFDVDPSLADIAGYRIWYLDSAISTMNPVQITTATVSPAVVTVPNITGTNTTITWWCQPFLTSGLTLPLSACPTCTSIVTSSSTTQVITITVVDPLTGHTYTFQIGGDGNIGSGFSSAGIISSDVNNGFTSILTPNSLEFLNNSPNPLVSLGSSSNRGQLIIFDGTNSGGLSGFGDVLKALSSSTGNGQIQMIAGANTLTHTAGTGTPGTPGTVSEWIAVVRNGVTKYFPLYV